MVQFSFVDSTPTLSGIQLLRNDSGLSLGLRQFRKLSEHPARAFMVANGEPVPATVNGAVNLDAGATLFYFQREC